MSYKIILTTDFSENARIAADYTYARFPDAHIFLMHVFGTPQVGHSVMISIDDILEKDARAEMENEMSRLSREFPYRTGITETVLINGEFANALKEVITNREANLVIMGTKGAGAIKGKLFGSNASKMIGRLNIPLLLVPDLDHSIPSEAGSKAVLASDLNAIRSVPALVQLVKQLQPGECELDVLYVSQGNETINQSQKEQLLSSLQVLNPEFHRIAGENVSDVIEEFVQHHGNYLLIMVHRKHSMLDKLFKSSVSKNLALSIKVPTLVLNEDV